MVTVDYHPLFKKKFKKIKHGELRKKLKNQIRKIILKPEVGKPLRNVRKGTQELYVPPFRLSYSYDRETETIIILDFYHKDEQ